MNYNRTEPIERLLTLCLYLFLTVLIFLSAYELQYRDTDIFWALRSGQWILQNFAVPETDPFSYTFAGRAWVDFTWGFQVISYLFYEYGGAWTGLFILQLLITAGTFLVVGLTLSLSTGRRSWLVAVLLLTLFVSSYTRLFVRPHLFSYFFISAYFLILTVHEKRSVARGVIPWALYAIVPLQILWVNIHSSAILGIFIVGAYAAGGVIDRLLGRGFASGIEQAAALKRIVAVAVITSLVSVLNPYGIKLALFPFVHQGGVNADALRHIGEWSRIPLTDLILYFSPTPVTYTAFRVAFYTVVLAMLLNWRRLKTRNIILFAGAFYMAASHVRWVSQFAFFALPVAAQNLAAYFDAKRESVGIGYISATERLFRAAALLLSVLFVILISFRFFGTDARANYGVGIKPGNFPVENVRFLKRTGLAGNIYNEYIYGGYLIFNRPDEKVFIDGRTPTVYSPSFFWAMRTSVDALRWNRLVSEYGLELALVASGNKLCRTLKKSDNWRAVNFDEVSVLFVSTGGKNKELIDRYELKEAQVCTEGVAFKVPKERAALLALRDELKLFLLREDAGGLARAHQMAGQVEAELGEEYLESALIHLGKSVSIIDTPFARYDYGVALGKLKRGAEAVEQFELAVEAKPDFKEALLALGIAYYDGEEYEEALRWIKEYLLVADDTAVHMAYKVLGFAAIELKMHETAVDALQRAAFSTDDKGVLADIYFKLGNLFFEDSEFADGLVAYRRAVENEPEYAGVLSRLAKSHESAGRVERAGLIKELLLKSLESDAAGTGSAPSS